MVDAKAKNARLSVSAKPGGQTAGHDHFGNSTDAVRLALRDAGLGLSDVDGLLAIQPNNDPRSYALCVAQAD